MLPPDSNAVFTDGLEIKNNGDKTLIIELSMNYGYQTESK